MRCAPWLAVALALVGCSLPSPLAPTLRGSVGVPHSGFLTDAQELPKEGPGYAWRLPTDHHFGLPRLIALIADVGSELERQRPDTAPMLVAELSARGGGSLMPKHRSHRTGRDVDLLLMTTTLEGVPSPNGEFVKMGADGLGVTAAGRFVRFDTAREWLVVSALVRSQKAHVQWIFVSRVLEALMIEYALATGEPAWVIARAQTLMQQPGDSLPHDDHLHVRIACETEDFASGCEGGGPLWDWLPRPKRTTAPNPSALLDALLGPSVRPEPNRALLSMP